MSVTLSTTHPLPTPTAPPTINPLAVVRDENLAKHSRQVAKQKKRELEEENQQKLEALLQAMSDKD